MNSKFPLSVKSGNVTVKIYRVKHARAASGFVYAVAYYVGPRRFLPQFADLNDALREAKLRADLLNAGRHDSAAVTRADSDELKSARKLLDGVPLLSALQEWKSPTRFSSL